MSAEKKGLTPEQLRDALEAANYRLFQAQRACALIAQLALGAAEGGADQIDVSPENLACTLDLIVGEIEASKEQIDQVCQSMSRELADLRVQ